MRRYWLAAAAAVISFHLGLVSSAPAAFIRATQPDAAYTSSTTLAPITVPNGTNFSSVSAAGVTISFSSAANARTAPVQGSWATWSSPPFAETPRPRVGFIAATSAIFTFSAALRTFGLELEPNQFRVFSMRAEFFDGATLVGTVTENINGQAGARLFAGTTPDQRFTRVVISSGDPSGFGFAQVRFNSNVAAVPEPGTLTIAALAGLGLAGFGWRRRFR